MPRPALVALGVTSALAAVTFAVGTSSDRIDWPDGDQWAMWLTAVGTVGAVVWAVSHDLFGARFSRPVLTMNVEVTEVPTVGAGPSAWVRLLVANRKGRHSASDVQVILERLRPAVHWDGQNQWTVEKEELGMPLVWSHSTPPMSSGQVPPGFERPIDLVALFRDHSTKLQFQVHPQPAQDRHIAWAVDNDGRRVAMTIEADVALVATNADAQRYTVVIEYDGQWQADTEAAEHVAVGAHRRP